MFERSITSVFKCAPRLVAISFAILLPVASALIYPTYTHTMGLVWVEWTRIGEALFVAFELIVLGMAYVKGLDLLKIWRAQSLNIKFSLCLFVLAMIIGSTLFSKNVTATVIMSFTFIIHILFGCAIYFLILRSKLDWIDDALVYLAVGLVLLAGLTIWKFSFPPDPSQVLFGKIRWDNALPGFISVRHFGAWTGAIAAAYSIKILYPLASRPSALDRLFYVLAATMTVWSGTRAAILSMIIVFAILLVTTRRFPKADRIWEAMMLTGLTLCLAWVFAWDDPSFSLFILDDIRGADAVSGGRIRMWAGTIQAWITSPWFGLGTGSTFWEVFIGWPHTQPHNFILQFLINWGMVGAAGALWLLARLVQTAHLNSIGDLKAWPYLAILYSMMIQAFFEGMLHYPRFITLILFTATILVAWPGLRQGPCETSPSATG